MGPKIAIVGMGAIGGYIGGMLTKAGVDITFVDQWSEHIAAVRANGLLVNVSCCLLVGSLEPQAPAQQNCSASADWRPTFNIMFSTTGRQDW